MADERELIKKAQSGDVDAFEEIVKLYEKRVYSLALRMTQNPQDAFDASQEVFIKIYNFLPSFKWESSFYTWVYRITVNKCIDINRKLKRQRTFSIDAQDEDSPAFDIPDEVHSPESRYGKKEAMEAVMKALDKLSDEHKAVIILRDIKGLSYLEIADVVDCSEGTVKSRISRAREKLREILEKKGNFFDDVASYR